MDYQTFNSQHPSFGGPFSTLPGTPAHLSQPTHSPQQQQQYTDPHGRFLQSTPSPFPYAQQQQYANGQQAGYPGMGGGVAANGGLMQPGSLSHNQLHQARGKPTSTAHPAACPSHCLLPALPTRLKYHMLPRAWC